MVTIDQLIEENILNNIDTSINIDSFYLNTSGIETILYLKSCNWKWIGIVRSIEINGVYWFWEKSDLSSYDYMVRNYQGTDPQQMKLKNFHMYEGTPIDVTQVFEEIDNRTWEKLPMMWLSFYPLPVISGTIGGVETFPIDLSFTLYFAAETDYLNRHTKNHMREVISFIDSYVDEVLIVVEQNGIFRDEFTFKKRPLPIFGRLDREGFKENILDETNLSAIELELNVSTYIQCKC